MANRADTLVYLAGQNAVTLHHWPSRADRLDRPDCMFFDLDPPEGDFGAARIAALALGEMLRELGLEPFAMTTAPRGSTWWSRCSAARSIRRCARCPRRCGEAHRARARAGHARVVQGQARRPILIDVRATRGMSVVAPYSVRAKPEASVAAPIPWEELSDESSPRGGTPSRTCWTGGRPLGGDRRLGAVAGRAAKRLERLDRDR